MSKCTCSLTAILAALEREQKKARAKVKKQKCAKCGRKFTVKESASHVAVKIEALEKPS